MLRKLCGSVGFAFLRCADFALNEKLYIPVIKIKNMDYEKDAVRSCEAEQEQQSTDKTDSELERSPLLNQIVEQGKKLIDRGLRNVSFDGYALRFRSRAHEEKIKVGYLSDEEVQHLLRVLKDYAKKVREELKEKKKASAEALPPSAELPLVSAAAEGEGEPRTKEAKEAKSETAGKRFTLQALDQAHAKVARNLVEQISWFADVLHEIGFYAVVTAMQVAKVDPNDYYQKILEFKDPRSSPPGSLRCWRRFTSSAKMRRCSESSRYASKPWRSSTT